MSAPTFVYFIQPQAPGAAPIKIGSSVNLQGRLEQLEIWSPYPLELLVAIPGDAKLERNIQGCFADCHSHREWFHPHQRLVDAIRALRRGVPVHEAIDLTDIRGNVLGLTQAATRRRNGTKLGRRTA